jgi:hypothetical protein
LTIVSVSIDTNFACTFAWQFAAFALVRWEGFGCIGFATIIGKSNGA